MDLFSDFSFANATSSRRPNMYNDLDMEDISPSSSRSASPVNFYPAPTSAFRNHPVSMEQLSANFDRHSLDNECSSSSPLFSRLQHPSGRRAHSQSITSSPPGDHDSIRRRRQSGARALCSGARLASIETLVDRMLRDGSSCFASLHPSSGSSSRHSSRKSSITSAPTSIPTPRAPSTSEDPTEDEDDSDAEGNEMVSPAYAMVSRARFGGGVAAAAAKRRGGVEKLRRQRSSNMGKTR